MNLKYDHLNKYIDLVHHGHYDYERKLLHERIIDKFLSDKNAKPSEKNKLLFTSGPYGAGKTHTIKYLDSKGKIDLNEWIHIDPDKIRVHIPEYSTYLEEDPWSAGYKTNKEACYICEILELYLLFNNYNIIIDGSMRDYEWYVSNLEWIKTTFPNYEILILHVRSSWSLIKERVDKRSKITKRFIPEDILLDSYNKTFISFNILREYVHKSYLIHNEEQYIDDEINLIDF